MGRNVEIGFYLAVIVCSNHSGVVLRTGRDVSAGTDLRVLLPVHHGLQHDPRDPQRHQKKQKKMSPHTAQNTHGLTER